MGTTFCPLISLPLLKALPALVSVSACYSFVWTRLVVAVLQPRVVLVQVERVKRDGGTSDNSKNRRLISSYLSVDVSLATVVVDV
jgi:hypothetical protein